MWEYDAKALDDKTHYNLSNNLMDENTGISQEEANKNIEIKCHGQECGRIHGKDVVEKRHLSKASRKGDLLRAQPDNAKGLKHTSTTQNEISRSQHGKNFKNGLMKAMLYGNKVEKNTFYCKGHKTDNMEENCYPDMELLQAWNSQQGE